MVPLIYMLLSYELSQVCRRRSSAVGLISGSTCKMSLTNAQSAFGTSKISPMKDNVIGIPVGASLGENLEISSCHFLGARSRNVLGCGIIVHSERKNYRSCSSVGTLARPPIGWKSFAPGSICREPIWTTENRLVRMSKEGKYVGLLTTAPKDQMSAGVPQGIPTQDSGLRQ
jgi:hypothetical protein